MSLEIILKNELHDFQLAKNKGCDDKLIFSVLCGGIGIFEVTMYLNTEEVKNYKDQGEDYLIRLSRDISKNLSKYESRLI